MSSIPYIAAAVATVLALTAVARNARSIAHLSFGLGLLLLAIESVIVGVMPSIIGPERMLELQTWQWRVSAFVPGTWLLFSLTYSRGNYREFIRRAWPTLLGAYLLPVALAFGVAGSLFRIVRSDLDPFQAVVTLQLPGFGLQLLMLIGCVLILLNVERTFRSAVGTMRWRIKFVMLGLAVLFAVRIYTSSQTLLYRAVDPTFELVNAGALLIACLLIGISLVRTRLFAIDLYPSHAVLRHSLTIGLVGAYLLIVGVLAKVVEWLGGTTAFPLKAFVVLVALVLLTLLLMSDRVRQATQRFVSRHLRRPSYDYRQVWQSFSERISPNVTIPDLAQSVVRWISETFNVLSATVWVVDDSRKRLVLEASTAVDSTRTDLPLSDAEFAALGNAMVAHREPLNLDNSTEPWADSLKRAIPAQFAERGGNRYSVPLVHAEEWLGLITLGDRVSGVRYSLEDLDLLRCLAGQVAASLLSLRLARKLVEARELEAFQAMSAFFVHDLKNTASTLTLMFSNLPKHFDNPEFRKDALHSLAKCIERMNNLIGQLTVLRKGLELKPRTTDLAQLVEHGLATIQPPSGIRLVKDLQSAAPLSIDPEQIQKVLTNLVLNAFDAVNSHGEIKVATADHDGWATLTVADNGSGMNPEFIRTSLFRPFQTTKKQGIGIGLFHCRTIVEAHGGRIEVESEVGRGTTFRVWLARIEDRG